MSLLRKIIPRQIIGFKTGASVEFIAPTTGDAKVLFLECKWRLLNINNWYLICGEKGSEFQLTDDDGNPLEKDSPEVGNLIRVKLPSPPNAEGDGYDWVRIEKLEATEDTSADEELYGFRVRPVSNPTTKTDARSHFYTGEATSTFLVYRKKNKISVYQRGRNELPNHTGSFINKIRDLLVALLALLGFSKPQWKRLVKGVLNQPNY